MNAPPQSVPAAPDYAIPPRYTLLDTRSDGLGGIYVCLDNETRTPVVLKSIKPADLDSVRRREDFLQEAALWIFLGHHPHRVTALRIEFFDAPRIPYLVLEWIGTDDYYRDSSLAGRLERGRPLPVGRSLLYALQVVAGLQQAEQRVPGLVHHDIKPANILLGADGAARISDFGLARTYVGLAHRATAAPGALQAVGLPGTAPYRAPEQWVPRAVLDRRSDIYSLGCTLFEMVTGHRAAPGRDIDSVRRSHQTGELAPVPAVLPACVARLIERATARRREERYAAWEAMAADLSAAYRECMGLAPPCAEVVAADGAGRAAAGTVARGFQALGQSYCSIGQPEAGSAFYRHALQLAEADQNNALQSRIRQDLAVLYGDLGRFDQALELLDAALRNAAVDPLSGRRGELLAIAGGYHLRNGNVDAAERCINAALEQARASSNRLLLATATGNLGALHGARQQHDNALRCFANALALYQEAGDLNGQLQALENVGHALCRLARDAEALSIFEQLHRLACKGKDIPRQLHALAMRAETGARIHDHAQVIKACTAYMAAAQQDDPRLQTLKSMLADAKVVLQRVR